ncbi:hypothetical protein PENANT_c041G08853, partial [Penicillium antarcticum]
LSRPFALPLLLPAVLDPPTDHPLSSSSKSDNRLIRSAGRTSRTFDSREFRTAIGNFIARHPVMCGDPAEGGVVTRSQKRLRITYNYEDNAPKARRVC